MGRVTVLAGMVAALLAGGCRSAKETRDAYVLPAEAGATPADRWGGPVLGDNVYPRRAMTKTYVVVGGVKGKGQPDPRVHRVVEPRADGTWLVRTGDPASATPERSDVLTRTGAGVALIESTDHVRGTITRFSGGGLLMMPAALHTEEAFSSTVVAEVFGLAEGELRERGVAQHDVEWLGGDLVSTPIGEFDAARLRAAMQLSLGQTVVERETTLWVTGDRGVVAEEAAERVKVFNVPVRTSTRLLLLEEHAEPAVLEPGQEIEDPIGAMLGG